MFVLQKSVTNINYVVYHIKKDCFKPLLPELTWLGRNKLICVEIAYFDSKSTCGRFFYINPTKHRDTLSILRKFAICQQCFLLITHFNTWHKKSIGPLIIIGQCDTLYTSYHPNWSSVNCLLLKLNRKPFCDIDDFLCLF